MMTSFFAYNGIDENVVYMPICANEDQKLECM